MTATTYDIQDIASERVTGPAGFIDRAALRALAVSLEDSGHPCLIAEGDCMATIRLTGPIVRSEPEAIVSVTDTAERAAEALASGLSRMGPGYPVHRVRRSLDGRWTVVGSYRRGRDGRIESGECDSAGAAVLARLAERAASDGVGGGPAHIRLWGLKFDAAGACTPAY